MKLPKINLLEGKISLGDKIIDYKNFELRNKITNNDLNTYYHSFISHCYEIREYFNEKHAFDNTVHIISTDKKPKLIAREPKYPLFYSLREFFSPEKKDLVKRLGGEYFVRSRCRLNIPLKKGKDLPNLKESHSTDLKRFFEKYNEYEGVIEIPNNLNLSQTKSDTFHESLHYLIAQYQATTGRRFIDNLNKENLSAEERTIQELSLNEIITERLTDRLLFHDKNALFENRLQFYSLNSNYFHFLTASSASITAAILLCGALINPYLIPISIIPGRIKDYLVKEHWKSIKKELLIDKECRLPFLI